MATDRLSRTAVALAGIGVAVAVAGLVLALLQRSGGDAAAIALLVVGTVLCLASAGCGVAAARRPAGLTWPEGVTGSWPTWPWWWAVGGAGVLDLLAGPLVAGWIGVVGLVLVAVSLGGLGRDLAAPGSPVDRRVVAAARRLQGPAAGRPEAQAAVSRIGALGVRLVMFDSSGRLADVVVRDPPGAALAAQLAGVRVVPPAELHPPARTRTPTDPNAR